VKDLLRIDGYDSLVLALNQYEKEFGLVLIDAFKNETGSNSGNEYMSEKIAFARAQVERLINYRSKLQVVFPSDH